MYCKKCGHENKEGAKFCSICGEQLETSAKNESASSRSKGKKNKGLIIGVAIALVIVIGIVLIGMQGKKSIKTDRIKEDILQAEYYDRDETIKKVTVISNTVKDNVGDVIVQVVSDNETAEFSEKYSLHYVHDSNCEDNWALQEVAVYDEESWGAKPLVEPTEEDMMEACESYIYQLHDHQIYDEYTISDTPADINLDEGTAYFYYNVNNDTVMKNVHGELEFECTFDSSEGCWIVVNCVQSDSFVDEYNYNYEWSGADDKGNGEFSLTGVSVSGEQMTATFTENGTQHQMSGSVKKTSILLQDVNDSKYCLDGNFAEDDGYFTGTLYRAYTGETTIYIGNEFSNVKMNIQ